VVVGRVDGLQNILWVSSAGSQSCKRRLQFKVRAGQSKKRSQQCGGITLQLNVITRRQWPGHFVLLRIEPA
jgi:hypothetical protein